MHPEALDTGSGQPSNWNANTSLAAQLERAKEDLELAAYAVSHDLKAPLRAITYACETLNALPDFPANEKAKAPLQSIARESARMGVLMQGLLDYLNLETFGPTRALIESREIVETALTILDEKIRSLGAKITCDALPPVFGHRGRLTRLFMNIIDNGLKFHGVSQPVLQISARVACAPDFVEFRVEDNGIGIKEEFRFIIFQLFQRLHISGDYPGEGIGLALSRKIVESHGRKLWVEPVAEQGCCFCFTLPTTRIN